MARALYEGNPALSHGSYLNSYPEAKAELTAAIKNLTLPGRRPDSLGILADGNLDYFTRSDSDIDAALAWLDATGDLRFLDHIHRLITLQNAALKTDFVLMPDGSRSEQWRDHPSWYIPGYKHWRYLWREDNEGIPSPDYFGTDLQPAPIWLRHGAYATAALAMKTNIGKPSPAGRDYGALYAQMTDYLLNHFEPLWKARGFVRPAGKVGAGGLDIPSEWVRGVINRTRYHRAMYLMHGRSIDNTLVNLTGPWALASFETHRHDGHTLAYWSSRCKAATTDRGRTASEPYPFELTHLLPAAVAGIYHLRLMGESGYSAELLGRIANTLRYSVFIDGPDGEPSYDVGGGGPGVLGLTQAERKFVKVRGGTRLPSRFMIPEADVPSKRWSSQTFLDFAISLCVPFGSAAAAQDLRTVRDRHDSLTKATYWPDKVALGLYHLAESGWERDPTAPTDPGGEPPPSPGYPTDRRAEGLAWLEAPYIVHSRLEVFDGERAWTDLGSHQGESWFRGCEWGSDIDSPIATLTADVGLTVGDRRMSPLIARALDVGRAVRLSVALVPPGTPVAAATTWRRAFKGFIDDVDITPGGNVLRLACSDQAGLIRDTFIEEPSEKRRVYGAKPTDQSPGMSREEVMLKLLTDNGMGQVEMVGPVPSQSYVMPYLQARTSLWQALQEHALQIGWDLRYRYVPTDGPGRFELTFREPGRGKTEADYRLALKDFLSLKPIKLSLPDIRNVVEVTYFDRDLKRKNTVKRAHLDSISRYNRRYMAMQEDAGSLIDTAPEAEALAASILADLAYPKATSGFDRLFWPYVELGEVVQLEADFVTFDVEPRLAVTSYRHTLQLGRERTDVSLRDERPAGAHTRWLERQAGVKGVDLPVPVLPGDRPIQKDPPRLETRTEGPRDQQRAFIIARVDEDPKGIAEYYNWRWRLGGEEDWETSSGELLSLKMPRLENGKDYEVQVQVSSPRGLLGPWSASASIRTAVDQIPPAPVQRVQYYAPAGENQGVWDAQLYWQRSYDRDFNYTRVQVRYDNEDWHETDGQYFTSDTVSYPAHDLYFLKNRWSEPSERFWVRLTHIDQAGNESQTLEAGPIQFDGANVTDAVGGVLLAPTSNSPGGVNGGPSNPSPGDGSGSGVGDGSGEGDEGGGGDGGLAPQLGPGVRFVGKVIVVAPETHNPDVMSAEARELVDRLKRVGKIDSNEFGWYTNIRAWNGKTGTGNLGGQYHCCRRIQDVVHTLGMAFFASGDPALLDMMAYAWTRFDAAIEGPGRARADKSGPDRAQADGFAGIPYGNGPSGAIQTNTGHEIPLEDGVGAAGLGIIYMFLRLNQGRYSPRHEPVGSRPASPAYYKARADEVKAYIVNHQRAKYEALYAGKIYGGDKRSAYKLEMPLWVGKGFAHTQWSEIAQAIGVAFADGGDNPQAHADYKQAKESARLILDHEYDGGQSGTVRWCKTSFGDALYWGQYCQWWRGSYKDGKRVPRTDEQFTQPGTYLNEVFGHMNFVKHMTGSDIISDAEMKGAARTYAYSVLNPKLTVNRQMSGNMSSNGTVLPDTWYDSPGKPYDLERAVEGAYSILMPYDSSGRIEEVVLGEWNVRNQPARKTGWPISKLNDLIVNGGVRVS